MRIITAKIISANGDEIFIGNNIISTNIEALDRGTMDDVLDWGIYSNQGSFSFIDINNEFDTLTRKDSKGDITVLFYLSSDLYDNLVGTFIIKDFDYNYETKVVNVRLTDGLERWQDINVSEVYPFDATYCYELVDQVSQAANEYKIATNTSSAWRNMRIYCPYLQASTLWDDMAKICVASHCRVYKNKAGYAVFATDDVAKSKPIVIAPYNIKRVTNHVPKTKTRISNVAIDENTVAKRINKPVTEKVRYTLYALEPFGVVTEDDGTKTLKYIIVDVSDKNTDVSATTVQTGYGYDANIEASLRLKDYTHKVRSYVRGNNELFGVYTGTIYRTELLQETEIYGLTPHIQEDLTSPSFDTTATYIYDERFSRKENIGTVSFTIVGARRTLTPERVISNAEIYFNGDYFENVGSTPLYQNNNDNPVKLPSNELVQSQNDIYDTSLNQLLLNSVYQKLKNGVECYEIECSVDDYYYEDGSLALDASGADSTMQIFDKYMIVIPYVMRNGKNQPLSFYADGSPKQFSIIGTKLSFNGVLKQTLVMQENVRIEL